ncbi:hypothetical protein KPL71_013855 [Citrus sinensis]|uniref:Uncharacterized protein n=1 Tax=Citrus sinensis TaxID=2711 RepID=A0ACB8K7Q2_CITSI|nr:hypothetical protein KPL71_013855 [Citrus sinensis]
MGWDLAGSHPKWDGISQDPIPSGKIAIPTHKVCQKLLDLLASSCCSCVDRDRVWLLLVHVAAARASLLLFRVAAAHASLIHVTEKLEEDYKPLALGHSQLNMSLSPWISGQPPEDTLKRWKSACNIVNNRRRKFRMVANLANQAETRVNTFKIQNKAYKEFYDDDPSSEYLAKAGIFQEFYDDIEYACKGRYVELLKRKKAVVFPWEESSLSYPVLKATSYGVYILCHLVFKAFSSVRNIFSNLLLGVEFVRHKFQYYMSLCNYIVTEAAKVRRRQDCPNNVEYVSYHDDDDSKGHPISEIMEPGNNVSPNGKFRRRITSWQKGELLGSGSYGFVYEGLTDDGFFFAVKEVSLQDEGPRGKQSILQLEQVG